MMGPAPLAERMLPTLPFAMRTALRGREGDGRPWRVGVCGLTHRGVFIRTED